MNKNNRAGVIPKNVLKNLLTLSATTHPWDSTWDCEILVKIAGKQCGCFYTCSDCIDYTLNWFYTDDVEGEDNESR